MAKKEALEKDSPTNEKITFHYIKNQGFRVLHVDGCIGSITPQGNIHLSVFSERPAIPRELTHKLTDNHEVGEIVERVSREGIVREMDADLILTLNTAKNIYQWLGEKINQLELLQNTDSED